MNRREKILHDLQVALPDVDALTLDTALAVVLSNKLEDLHYAKEAQEKPMFVERIKERHTPIWERQDGWRTK